MKAALATYASGVVQLLLTGMLSSVKKNNILSFNQASSPLQCSLLLVHFANGNAMTNKHRLRKGKGLEKITKSLGTKVPIQIVKGMKRPEKPLQATKFAFECGLVARNHLPVLPHFKEYKNKATLLEDYIGKVVTIKHAWKDILQKNSKNRRHKIKKKYFDTVAANKVSTKSPGPDLTDGEWQALVEMWSIPRHKLEMEKRKDAPVLEGEEPKSAAEIVEEMLKTEVKQSTFLRNVGLKSSSYNSGKGTAAVAAHVRDLEQKLERSELQAEVMQEEMAPIKMKAEEYEDARDKELELLRKKSQEQEEKLVHFMALFGAKAS
ncbi:hypothetical protein D1007_15173 [Hordeum vulgare]|nr:hypothetical protein D1007_15173 [Hordeum vulgare]